MSPNVTLAIIAGALVACGVYLITERSLSRILMGVMVAGNGVNLLFLVASGAAGGPPLIGVTPKEEESLRVLLAHIDGLAPSGVDAVCRVLHGKIPAFSNGEMDLVYSELRAICDGNERKQIMSLLLSVAAVDGRLSDLERRELERIAEELGVDLKELDVEPAAIPLAPGDLDAER